MVGYPQEAQCRGQECFMMLQDVLKGWKIPRMNDDLKIYGWALNSEYFATVMHELRNDPTYRAIFDLIVEVPEKSDTRDT